MINVLKINCGLIPVYCDGVVCHVLCLRHGIPVSEHIGQSTNATSRRCRDMTSDISMPHKTQNKTSFCGWLLCVHGLLNFH